MLQMFVLALSLYNTWNRGVFLLCKITNLLIYRYINKQQVHFNNTANSVGDKNNINKLLEKIRMIPAKDGKNIYSGGENQKLCIVKALLKNSDVLIMDEPTSSLDIASTNILKEILFNQKKEKIIILISHDKYLEEICDQIIDLDSMKVNAE